MVWQNFSFWVVLYGDAWVPNLVIIFLLFPYFSCFFFRTLFHYFCFFVYSYFNIIVWKEKLVKTMYFWFKTTTATTTEKPWSMWVQFLNLQRWSQYFETFKYFTDFFFRHKWNGVWLIAIKIFKSCVISCKAVA